jgi:hypothetical protein
LVSSETAGLFLVQNELLLRRDKRLSNIDKGYVHVAENNTRVKKNRGSSLLLFQGIIAFFSENTAFHRESYKNPSPT